MADLYDTLSAADQATFRATLFAVVNPAACPTVDVSSMTSADSLNDAATRALAVDCAQTALHVGGSGPGVLDQATYNAIMHPAGASTGWSTQTKVAVGASVVVGAFILWKLFDKRKR